MNTVTFAPSAEAEINAIASEIREENPPAASRWVLDLEEKCQRLAQFPRMGRQRDDFIPGVFYFPYGKYLILYDITLAGITIVHVIHGARDIERALSRSRKNEHILAFCLR